MAMNLPHPTAEEVEVFKVLYAREFGAELTNEEAWDTCTRALQLVYICTYGRHHLKDGK